MESIGKKIARVVGLTSVKDGRSKRFVAVIDCILNQNVRDFGAARFPAMNKQVLELCMKYDVGLLQIPCPERAFLGLKRERPQGDSIRKAFDTAAGRRCCRDLSIELAARVQDYLASDYEFIAVLGGNVESPGCAVHHEEDTLAESSGVFMKEFDAALKERGIVVPFRGIHDDDPDQLVADLEWLEQRLSRGPGSP